MMYIQRGYRIQSGCRWHCYTVTNKFYLLQPQYGWSLADQQPENLDVLRKSHKCYKKLFLRFRRECALAAYKLYKKEGWKDDFVFFFQDVCTLLLQNVPRV